MDFTRYTRQFIGGEWREGSSDVMMRNYNPYTGELIHEYRAASKQDMDDAFAAAKAAQPAWAATLPRVKSEKMEALMAALNRRKADLFDILRAEGGVVVPKCHGEFNGAMGHMRQAVSFPYRMDGKIMRSDTPQERINYIIRKPKGVIAVIAPWNAPFILAVRSVIPAVATGNAVVLRPSSNTPMTAFFLAELFEEAGFPKGVLNVISGPSSETGDAFVTHPDANLVSFTGSTEVGRRIGMLCGERLTDVSLELGGNNPSCVLPDADLENAAKGVVWGSLFHAGQVCMCTNRVIVHKDIYDKFVPMVVDVVKKLKVGDPKDPTTFIGPLASMHQVKSVNAKIQAAIAAGAKVAWEGKTEGGVVYPWVLCDAKNDMPGVKDEMFGPVVTLIKAESEEEMIRLANDTEYGLSSAVFGGDEYHCMRFARRMQSGMVFVNDQTINEESHIIFGGEKQSGVGRFNGQWVLEKFTTEQRIGVQEELKPYF